VGAITNAPHPEQAKRVEGRNVLLQQGSGERALMAQSSGPSTPSQIPRSIARDPDIWLGGIAVAIGLGVGAYDKSWQSGLLVDLASSPCLAIVYALPAWMFGWPQVSWVNTIDGFLNLLGLIGTILSFLG
jgi:hypothetical protein